MIGFNNLGYDYPLLHKFLMNKDMTPKELFQYGNSIIKASYGDDKWKYSVKDSEILIAQIDLYKIHHYDNKAKSTSLKMIEFNNRSDNIQELPYEVGSYLKSEEIDNLIKYNIHDVKETIKFAEESEEQIVFRKNLNDQYGFNSLNWNDTKIGSEYFIMELENAGVKCYDKKGDGKGKVRQTKRKYVDLGECILPYISFDTPEFKAVCDWLKKQRITETKGVFSDIIESKLGDVAKYASMETKKLKLADNISESEINALLKDNPRAWVQEIQLKAKLPKKLGGGFKKVKYLNWRVCETVNVEVDGLKYVYGTGGLHAAVEKRILQSDEQRVILSFDVSSFYPNISIKNKFFPEHLSSKFCEVYDYLYNLRKTFPKKSAENAMLKLALNGVYGKSNDQFSCFFDPKFTMQITLNGQLLLTKLVEMVKKIPTVEVVMCNTDGFEFVIDRQYEQEAREQCKKWEEMTNLTLEDIVYDKLIIRDVNNYIGVINEKYVKPGDSNLKRKGVYEYENVPNNKNHSAFVVKMAAEKYLINDVDPEEFVRSHTNIYDFMLRTKVPRGSHLYCVDENGNKTRVQNISRYYVSENGYDLIKVMPHKENHELKQLWVNPESGKEVYISKPAEIKQHEKKGYVFEKEIMVEKPLRNFNLEAGWKCKVCNNIKDFDGDINYNYYIENVWKLVNFTYDDKVSSEDNDTEKGETNDEL